MMNHSEGNYSEQTSVSGGDKTITRRKAVGTLAAGAGALLVTPSVLAAAPLEAAAQQVSGPTIGKLGIQLAHEQFPAPQLTEFGVLAEQAGFDNIWFSDHFQPWQDNQGHAGYARVTQAALGERTKRIGIGTAVTCPSFRYQPAEIAQAFATLSQFTPGRVALGVGSGEALNETAATGQWGTYQQRADRLVEAITIIRQLWSGQSVNFKGQYFQVQNARLYDAPPQPIPLLVSATGPKSMQLAGQYGDGLITLGDVLNKPGLLDTFKAAARAAGKDPTQLPVVVEAYAVLGDQAEAERWAELWRFGPWAWKPFVNNPNPSWIREQADALIPLQDVYKNWTVSTDPNEHAKAIKKLWAAGATQVNIHCPQADHATFLKFYGEQVVPLLKA